MLKLETNYRSSGSILGAAAAVIEQNRERKGKRLIASRGEGARPLLYAAMDERDEAAYVARALEAARSSSEQRVAVLLRTHAQTRTFEEEFLNRRIPHQVVGGLRFYERREIKDVVSYLKLVVNPEDDVSFARVVNMPPRGLGAQSLQALEREAKDSGVSLWRASELLLENRRLPARAASGLESFRGLRDRMRGLAPKLKCSELILEVVDQSGIGPALERTDSTEARDRLENIHQLIAAAADFEEREPDPSLPAFLDSVGLMTDVDQASPDAPCWIMTLHAAKGLEFDTVFLVGMEEGLFPHLRSLGDPKALEEERRLCYVGMTRARRVLVLTYAMSRRFGYQSGTRDPSRFLGEIPQELLMVQTGGEAMSQSAPRQGSFPLPRSGGSVTKGLSPGVIVRHAKFGEGRIIDASGRGRDRKVTVQFHKFGRKRLVAEYAKLEVLS